MNITQTSKGDNLISIKINILKEDYEAKVNASLKTFQRKANVPGFRPGKVPFGMVKKIYGTSVFMEELNKLISEGLNNHIIDNKLDLIGYPLNDTDYKEPMDPEKQAELDFHFVAATKPEINVDYAKFSMDFFKIVPTDEEVEKAIESIVERNPNRLHPETVGNEDAIEIKVKEADENGNEIEEGYAKTFSMHLDQVTDDESKNMLIGKELGSEFIFNFAKALGSDEAAANVLGKDAPANSNYNIIIDDIVRNEKPELNEEFFEKVFPGKEIKDLNAFKAAVKVEMEKQYLAESDRILFNKIIEKLVTEIEFALPDTFLKRWIVENSQGKITEEDAEKNYDNNYVKGLRWQLIEDAIVKQNTDLIVKDDEVREFMKRQFFPGLDLESLDDDMKERLDNLATSLMKNDEQVDNMRNQLADMKMTHFLKDKITINYKEVNYEEFAKAIAEEK